MELYSSHLMPIEIKAFGESLIASCNVKYDVFKEGKDFEDNLQIKDIVLGSAGKAHSFSQKNIEELIEIKMKDFISDYGAFDSNVVFSIYDDGIEMITRAFYENGVLDSMEDLVDYLEYEPNELENEIDGL